MACRDDADSQIENFTARCNLNTTVLGSTSFSNVYLAQDLDARNDGAQESSGGTVTFDQDAVDAIPDSDTQMVQYGYPKLVARPLH